MASSKYLLCGIAVAAVLAGGAYWYSTKTPLPSQTGQEIPPPFEATDPIQYGPEITAEVRVAIEAKAKTVRDAIATNPYDLYAWLNLGTYHKWAGDYQRAAQIWQYVASYGISNFSSVAYGNLGDLYMNFIKDFNKAEAAYTEAISIAPTYIDYYRSLFYLYKDLIKDTAKAKAVIDAGLEANPGNKDIEALRQEL